MAARKKTGQRKATARKAARKKTTRKRPSTALGLLEEQLPPSLKDYSRQVRRRLTQLERHLDRTARDARRRGTRLLRDASHQLGRVEARGEREWKRLTTQARRDAARLLRRLEKAIAPTPARKRAPAGRRR
jgi:hypothetical protein